MIFVPDSAHSAGPRPPGGPLAAQWKKIDALLAKDQPASAARLVDELYRQARERGDAPNYVRALLYKVRLLEAKEEDAAEKAIALLEADLKTATFPARPILHSLLAELYTNYLNQNRSRLYDRTAGASDPAGPRAADAGLATWDLNRLGAAIVRHYEQSVADEPARQLQTTLARLGDLAGGGDAEGRARRPTLYDLLAQRAIAGLQNQELYVTRPEEQFQVAEPRLFGSAAEFVALRLPASAADSLNGQLHALRLLQQLTARRLAPPAPRAALAAVDLQRLDYLRGLTEHTELAGRYDPALAQLAETYQDLPISTEFMARRAEAAREADPGAAVRLARVAEARFPKSRGAARARALREQIERPELTFSAPNIVVPNQPWRLDLAARNVTGLHAAAYRISLKEWASFAQYDDPRQRPWARRFARALQAAPAATWAVPVPTRPLNYKQQKLAAAGSALPLGYYLVVISNQVGPPTALPQSGTVTSYAVLGASELSAVSRRDPAAGALQLLVLHRQTGAPLAGVQAQATYLSYSSPARPQQRRLGAIGQSAAAGQLQLPALEPATINERLSAVRVWRGRDTLLLDDVGGYYQPQPREAEQARRQTFLFTDRAIYRPGQALYFKGILTETRREKSRLLTGQPVSLRLVDVNGQPGQTLRFTTSDFGSFNGSLVLPTGLLDGEMSLQTDDGSLQFAVEDYKRPTFLVKLDSVPGRPQLGQPLAVSGQARAYSGQATDGATVKFRVTRRTLWPLFDYGARAGLYPPRTDVSPREIAHGTTTTDAEGRFSLPFTPPLVPDQPRRGRWEPGYVFEITADVTDAAGETRTGSRSVVIGHNPLNLRLAGPAEADQQRLPDFTLLSTNATGEALPATGTLRLLARRYRPNLPGVLGPAPETEDNDAPTELVRTLAFDTKASTRLDLRAALAALPTGRYRLEAQAAGADSLARARLDFTLYNSQAATVPFATPDWFVSPADTVAPGQPATVLLGSSAPDARILLEVERGGQLLRQQWLTLAAGEQRRLTLESGPAPAAGPLYVHTTQVRDNHLYRHDATVQVAEKPQPLHLSISTFRDKLLPGEKETWRVTIRQADGQPADAELLATLYDQSLDVFRPHSFAALELGQGFYPALFQWEQYRFGELTAQTVSRAAEDRVTIPPVSYPVLRTWGAFRDNSDDYFGGRPGQPVRRVLAGRVAGTPMAAPAPMASAMADAQESGSRQKVAVSGANSAGEPRSAAPDLSLIPTRSDFRETAFWQPALRTDQNGDLVLEFQMPEAVTRWQLLALAHDRRLRTGQLARQLVTQKQLQITANAPRFVRPGDQLTLAAKVSNLTDNAQSGHAQLFLLDAATGQDLTQALLGADAQRPFTLPAHASAALDWPLTLPTDFAPTALTYRVVAKGQLAMSNEQLTDKKPRKNARQASLPRRMSRIKRGWVGGGAGAEVTDGEENTLPVLPNRVLLTESLPLPIVGPGTRTFELRKLTSSSSPTRRNYRLTLELTPNPGWLAVQSLPYLMEYPYEGSEQVFSRLYANLLAAHILRSNPRFKTMLAEWQRLAQSGTAAQQNALASRLEQNQELKNLLLQETPWVREAQTENERLARLATLFDQPRLAAETARALAKLRQLQLPGGAFPWFEKMPNDRYLTQLIVAGFGKLQKLGALDASQDETARSLLQTAVRYLDEQLARDYAALRRAKTFRPAADHLTDLAVQALYARSFWPTMPVEKFAQPAYSFFRQQGAAHWPGRARQLQAQLALAAFRADAHSAVAADIGRALAENALHSPELGMYWKEVRGGYYWREAPTETQAVLIETFEEVKNDQLAVEEMKLWLLKQKQVQGWESTRATADACYALLLRGADLLAPAAALQVQVGPEKVVPAGALAGTGYVKASWPAASIQPAQGRVTLTKTDPGLAWGALYWQYFEDLDKVTPAATPLAVERQLLRETRTAGGPVLARLTAADPLKVGDVVVVRLVLRTDRTLEYVHLKDQRAAGLELTAATSGYRYQNGLGYYESPRDAATNFFFAELPRGTHVFEYRLRAAQAGDFSGGLSQVQCLYAPEFGATSAAGRLRVVR